MKTLFGLFICTLSLSFAQEIPMPAGYSLVDTVSGDLNGDGKRELVVAYNTVTENEFEGVSRMLIIFQLENGQWKEWKKSAQALMGSRDGGMMGDPYGQMQITKGVLRVSHNGGSSWKWSVTDMYRFQKGEFYLIGYNSFSGKLCEYWTEVDFNLSTGKLIYTKEYERCTEQNQEIFKKETEEMRKKGLKITFQNRHEKAIILTTPIYKEAIAIAGN